MLDWTYYHPKRDWQTVSTAEARGSSLNGKWFFYGDSALIIKKAKTRKPGVFFFFLIKMMVQQL